ncbi:MAG: exodeoxyribonuclease VII small subunit [Paludibacteraceae bacterium]|nr:exodeoxyribonuclease VII small subunit [Paludibacteraceae bacterium]
MTYDEAIKKLDNIVISLENDDNISMDDYKKKASEAKKLIDFCRKQLSELDNELKELVK